MDNKELIAWKKYKRLLLFLILAFIVISIFSHWSLILESGINEFLLQIMNQGVFLIYIILFVSFVFWFGYFVKVIVINNLNQSRIKKFLTAVRYYKYFVLLVALFFFPSVFIDDWVFIRKSSLNEWLSFISIWLLYFAYTTLLLSIYYWIIAAIVIAINRESKV